MRQYPVFAVIACVLCMFCCGCPSDLRTPQERWSLFPSGAHRHFVQSVNTRYLWMRGGLWCGQVERYDMKERKLTTFTSRDGLPLNTSGVERLVGADDDRCLLMLDWEPCLFLYADGTGWRSLPPLGQSYEVKDVAFDSDGSVILLATDKVEAAKQTSCRIFSLADGKWRQIRHAKLLRASAIVPFPKAYVIRTYDGKRKLFRVSKSQDEEPVELPGQLLSEPKLKYYRVGGKTYMATPPPMDHPELPRFPGVRVMQTVREITPDGLVETPATQPQLLDLRTGTFQPMSVSVLPGRKVMCESAAIGTWEVDVHEGATIFPIRDINGDVWLPDRAFIAGKWVPAAGSRHEVRGIEAAQTDRAYYDDKEGRWRRTVPAEYGYFNVVDAKKKLAWVVSDYKAETMRLMDFSSRTLRIVQEVPREADWGLPSFRDRQGRWWMWRGNVVRLDPDGQSRRYPLKRPSAIWYSPKTGDIWAEDYPHYLKYDPTKDEFIPSKLSLLYDEYAFRLGPYEYSSLPLKHGLSMPSFMRKVDGRWEPVGIGARMGKRLLLNTRDGVWEYDAAQERRVRLHSYGGFHIAFDSQGRRVLANHHVILLYDGDPFKDPDYLQYAPLMTSQKEVLAECVKLLASPDDRVRHFAKRQIQGLSPLIKPSIEAVAEDGRMPEQTKTLLREALKNMSNDLLPPSLFEAAHPPCKPYESGAQVNTTAPAGTE